jgi:hypothetical protein
MGMPPASLGEAWKRSEPCKSLKASAGTMTKDENDLRWIADNLDSDSETSSPVLRWIRSESRRKRIRLRRGGCGGHPLLVDWLMVFVRSMMRRMSE